MDRAARRPPYPGGTPAPRILAAATVAVTLSRAARSCTFVAHAIVFFLILNFFFSPSFLAAASPALVLPLLLLQLVAVSGAGATCAEDELAAAGSAWRGRGEDSSSYRA